MGKKLVVIGLALLACSRAGAAANESARDIVQKADDLMRGMTMSGKYTMTIIRPEWQRSMVFKFWSEGTEKSFILMLMPARDKGVTFLKIGREMWNYIPRINRVIKIPPSMMLQSWMGSDFTNDDLVKESSVVDDYTHEFLGREEEAGFDAYKVALTPKPTAPVVWAKIVEWIRVDDYVPLKAEYYNERGELIRTLVFLDIEEMGGRTIPARFELIEAKKPGRKTVLLLEDAEFDKPLPKSVFTKQNLRRAR
ncbi:MAG: outer membrane lipoprotein-sorting protein [Calditrichaeota bacterium]|nr:outer membrane lipoprotein-sorting protein [Calditrichota bacterium]